MKHQSQILRVGLAFGLMLSGAVGFTSSTANAQAKDEQKTTSSKKQAGRDPFRKFEPPRVAVKKSGILSPPSIQERIEQYKAQKQAAMAARVAAPKPTTAFLLGELQVVGISRTPRGYAAIVEAAPIKLAYVIYPGERFYDGQLVAIEDNRLVFRREVVHADGRRERSVEMKPLRQPNAVNALAAVKPSQGEAVAEPDKKADPKPAAEKP